MTKRNTAKVFQNKSNLQMHRMKIWGNKVVAENNKVLKKENDMAEKSKDFFYVLNLRFWGRCTWRSG